MTKRKIIPLILYFIFTFLVGIVLVLFLPAIYLYSGVTYRLLVDSLISGNSDGAMALVGGYYNDEEVFTAEVGDNGHIVIYEAATLNYVVDESGEETSDTELDKAYIGFIYGIGDYIVKGDGTGQVKAILTVGGKEVEHALLDTDEDGDGTNDSIATFDESSIILLQFLIDDYSSIEGLKLIDFNGDTYYETDFDGAKLDYSTSFYTDIDKFLIYFNTGDDDETAALMQEDFLALSDSYKRSDYTEAESIADGKAARVVVIYFVIIYVLADMIFTKFIIKFVKFVIRKLFKVKKKEKPALKHNEGFGNDYFCAVTLSVDVTSVTGFDGKITVTYGEPEEDPYEAFAASHGAASDSSDSAEKSADKPVNAPHAVALMFELSPENNYSVTLRAKAGKYGNLQISVGGGYTVSDLPDTLLADGYKKSCQGKLALIDS